MTISPFEVKPLSKQSSTNCSKNFTDKLTQYIIRRLNSNENRIITLFPLVITLVIAKYIPKPSTIINVNNKKLILVFMKMDTGDICSKYSNRDLHNLCISLMNRSNANNANLVADISFLKIVSATQVSIAINFALSINNSTSVSRNFPK